MVHMEENIFEFNIKYISITYWMSFNINNSSNVKRPCKEFL